MADITLPSGSVHYRDVGQGEPLILLHANPGDSRDFDAVVPELSKGHRVIALDWPGYGESEPTTNPQEVDVLFYFQVFEEFVAALKLSNFSIIGNSVGGNVAARFAATHPDQVSRVVLVAPGGFTEHNSFTRIFCMLQGSRLSISPYWFARLYLRVRTPQTDEMLQRARNKHASRDCLSINRALWRSFSKPENDLREVAKTIQAPVLLMFGEDDPAISAKHDGAIASESIPHAEKVILPCGHAPFAEIPATFLEKTLPFLSSN